VLTESVARAAVEVAHAHGITLAANPKPANARLLQGASVVSLNQSEAEGVAGNGALTDSDSLEETGRRLRRELQVETLVITQGSKGLSVWTSNDDMRQIEAFPVEVYDVAGAGDT